MFLRGGLRSSRIPAICFQRFASSTPAHSKLHPELFNGVFTKFGWVLVKKTHVARGWTQAQINEALEKTLGDPSDNHDWNDIQEAVDDWTNRTCKKTVPQKKKKTLSEAKQEADMKIYLQQVRFNEENTPVPASKTEMKPFKKTTSDSVTFTNAWNYYLVVTYPNFKDLPPKEARSKVGTLWRQLSLDEKEFYRQEYTSLLESGKDILSGKIVDREVKLRSQEKAWQSKERSRLRKLGVLPPANRGKKKQKDDEDSKE